MTFKYELVKAGQNPTGDQELLEAFQNPVTVGDKVRPARFGSDLLLIVAVEHYPGCSVLYYA